MTTITAPTPASSTEPATTPRFVYRQAYTVTPGHPAARDMRALHKAVSGQYRDSGDPTTYDARFRADRGILFAAARDTARHQRSRHRVAPMGPAARVLAQAFTPPTNHAPFGGLTPTGAPILIDLDQYTTGATYDVRVIAHPTMSQSQPRRPDGTKPRGKSITISHPDQVSAWLTRQFAKGGAALHPDLVLGRHERNYDTNHDPDLRMIEGRITIADATAFKALLAHGLGAPRDRSYGAGLILTRPAQD